MALGLRETTTAQDMANSTVVPDSDALEAPQEETYIVKKDDKLGQLAVQFVVHHQLIC